MEIIRDAARESEARYAAMEQSAGIVLAVMLLVATVSYVFFNPGLPFAVGSLGAGIGIYFCWRANLVGNYGVSAAFAIGSLLFALGGLSTEIERPLRVLLCVGLSLMASGLYAMIFLRRIIKKQGGDAV
jgi:hypothetical protein